MHTSPVKFVSDVKVGVHGCVCLGVGWIVILSANVPVGIFVV